MQVPTPRIVDHDRRTGGTEKKGQQATRAAQNQVISTQGDIVGHGRDDQRQPPVLPRVVPADHLQPPPDGAGRDGGLHAALPRPLQLQLRSAGHDDPASFAFVVTAQSGATSASKKQNQPSTQVC